jgi:hypothetical protein
LLTGLAVQKSLVEKLNPLVPNPGLGSGDLVDLTCFRTAPHCARYGPNPIDCAEQEENSHALRERVLTVEVDCP